MKIKNILMCSLLLAGLSSCNDFLDVEAPSKVTDEQVFSSTEEADRLLNAVYQSTCSSNTYGNAYLNTFNFSSDVEFSTSKAEIKSVNHNDWKQFDGEADGSSIKSTWDAAYQTIERANNFVNAAEKSSLYGNADLDQMIGEAKCIRAMNYLDMVILWGDIPFTFTRTYDQESLIMPMGNRDEILTALINDLKQAAPKMKKAKEITEGVERCSKEFAWSLIARISMFRAGYSLRHGEDTKAAGTMERAADYEDYYKIARTYADSVIQEGTHALTNDYMKVFNDECNYAVVSNDDVIFEIPFVQNVNGNIGYIQGPKADFSSAGDTDHPWGKMSGSVGLNAFYRFTFDKEDVRRNTVGYWSYGYNGIAALQNSYTNYCLKWSKLWDRSHTQGNTSEGNTGINFPYMRYADVLLMFAEAENELNGPTDAAKNALKQVRERAFRGAANKAEKVDGYVSALGTKDEFFKAIVDERAWEFGGENIRWKDLVRWNLYSQVLYKNFWKYYGMGCNRDDSYEVDDIIFNDLPNDFFYRTRTRAQWNQQVAENPEKYNADNYPEVFNFANTDASLGIIEVYKTQGDDFSIDNLWENWGLNGKLMPHEGGEADWKKAYLFDWQDENTGIAKAECRCSIRGYIFIDELGIMQTTNIPEYSSEVDLSTLPSVRYILPIPKDVISRSLGQYKNYYGY